DVGVGQPVGAEPPDVVGTDRGGVAGDLVGEVHDRDLGRGQDGAGVVGGDAAHCLGVIEPVPQHLAVGHGAVGRAQGACGGEGDQLVPAQGQSLPGGAVELAPTAE